MDKKILRNNIKFINQFNKNGKLYIIVNKNITKKKIKKEFKYKIYKINSIKYKNKKKIIITPYE